MAASPAEQVGRVALLVHVDHAQLATERGGQSLDTGGLAAPGFANQQGRLGTPHTSSQLLQKDRGLPRQSERVPTSGAAARGIEA